MKFETPAGTNPIDAMKVIGQAVDRVDGKLKTTGQAPYAYEHSEIPAKPAFGYVIGAGIAKGRIASFNAEEARRMPGVLAIVSAENAQPLGKGSMNTAKLLGGPNVDHYHQALAVVVAESFEQARSAANAVRITYDRAQGRFDLVAQKPGAQPLTGNDADTHTGDFEGAFASAPVQVDQTYTTPDQNHAMMEPFATIAWWEGDALSVWTSNQMIAWNKRELAKTFQMPPDKVHVRSPFIGGGFGGKLFLRADAVMAALGAKACGRPVKIAMPRPLMLNNATHRPATIQRIRLGSTRDGKLTAIGHESWSGDLPGGGPETATQQTRLLYAAANRLTALRLAELDLPEANAMRAPGEAPGLMALEIAIDEMAEKLAMDPVKFRVLNDTQVDPDHPQRPFSQRNLVRCLEDGAARFGWSRRSARPAQMREGRWLIGMGVAAGFRNNINMTSAARVRLAGDGTVTVETDMTDIGTGSYTIIAQTAAEMMGLPLEKVRVKLGDSSFPVSAGSGGQWGANSSTSGVYAACAKLRDLAAQSLGMDPASVQFADGDVRAGNRSAALADAAKSGELVAEETMQWGDLGRKFQQSTFGAHFVEVAVNSYTGETRVRRMLAVCAAGRILNPKTARSQVIGAMTMGVGGALMEELAVDKRFGFFVNHDLAGYLSLIHI